MDDLGILPVIENKYHEGEYINENEDYVEENHDYCISKMKDY